MPIFDIATLQKASLGGGSDSSYAQLYLTTSNRTARTPEKHHNNALID
jgi:hypothetical protein